MTDLILHHFDTSPFSEKVRLTFGLKGLDWRSVEIPSMMPKPDYVPLTGGYRRTPSLQIGADVYCDTQVILSEIERRHPSPSLFPAGLKGLAWAINLWADRPFFQATVPIIFGALADHVPQAFIEDRKALSGGGFDPAVMKAAVEPMKQQWRGHAGWIERQLSHGKDWLGGDAAGLGDIAAYMNVWFLSRNLEPVALDLTQGFERLRAWSERVKAIGHGKSEPLSAEDALSIAKAAEPAPAPEHDPFDPLGAEPGTRIFVAADDYGRDPVTGTLVAANPERVTLAREDARVGKVHVHFPRVGYVVGRA